MTRTLLFTALLSAALLPGCIAVDGSSEKKPTVGQELVDLKAALDSGAITQAEYDQQKTRVLSRQ
jgi:hypothetical protein